MIVIISLYVDDLLLAFSDMNFLNWLKAEFSKRFEMQDCGEASVVLGLEIRRDRSKKLLHLSQKRYTEKVLERFGMETSKPVATPMKGQLQPSDIEGEVLDSIPYRQIIGRLIYLSVGTRPDIVVPVSRTSEHVEAPTTQIWVAAKRILRYLSGSKGLGILYQGSKPLCPTGYSDSDWGVCKINRKSTGGYAFVMSGGSISWMSIKQAPLHSPPLKQSTWHYLLQ